MEEEGCGCCSCCCGGEAGHRPGTGTQLIRQKETRLRRMVQCLAVALLLLGAVALGVLLTVVLGGTGQRSHSRQATMQPDSNSVVSARQQQQKDVKTDPSAMLTAPEGNIIEGDYLEWESDSGNAFCLGGFNYSSGSLVVPRSGIYRVFLQITYESSDDHKCPYDADELRLANRVVFIRDTYNTDVPLLSSVDTVSCGMDQWSKSLYTAGLFHLDANCRLRVTSSHPELIVKKEYQMFFGAELLPQ